MHTTTGDSAIPTPTDRTIQVGQFRTRYWAEGDHGPAVVLIHGVGGFVERWLPTVQALAAHHRVYAVDLPGHGRTDKPLSASYSFEDFAQFVRAFMAALDIERASLVGHSMGGGVSLHVALKFPAVVEKLVLVSSAGLGREITPAFRLASLPLIGELVTRPSRASRARFLRTVVYDSALLTDEFIDFTVQMAALPGAQQVFLKLMRAAFTVFGPREAYYGPILRGLASIDKPTLIVWGRQDRLVPVAHAQVAAAGLPNARVHILERCGHLPMLEQAETFNALLVEFLGG